MAGESSKVELVFTSEDKAIVATLQKMDRALDATVVRLNKVEQAGKKSSESVISGFGGMLTKFTSVGGAIAGATASLVAYNAQLGKSRAESDKLSLSLDEMKRVFNVQAGLSGKAGEKAQQQIQNIAGEAAFSIEDANKGAVQLASSGFSADQASGGSLRELLQGMAASNLRGTDPAEVAKSAAQFLAAQGLEKNQKNLRELLQSSQRLFKSSDFQVSDLSQLAGKSVNFQGKLSPSEILGSFDVLRNVQGADTASTGLKVFGERVMGASEDDQRKAILKRMKLTPADVDLTGENIITVLERFSKGMENIPEAQRKGTLQRFFGSEGAASAEVLIRDRAKIGEAISTMSDGKAYEADIREATGGEAAARRRMETMREKLLGGQGSRRDSLIRAAELNALDAGRSPADAAYMADIARNRFGFNFLPDEMAVDAAFGASGSGSYFGRASTAAAERVQREQSSPAMDRAAQDLSKAAEAMQAAAAAQRAAADRPVKVEGPMTFRPPASAAQNR